MDRGTAREATHNGAPTRGRDVLGRAASGASTITRDRATAERGDPVAVGPHDSVPPETAWSARRITPATRLPTTGVAASQAMMTINVVMRHGYGPDLDGG